MLLDIEEKKLSPKALLKEVYDNRFDPTAKLPDRPDYKLFVRGLNKQKKEVLYGVALGGSVVLLSGLPKTRKSTEIATYVGATMNDKGVCLNKVSLFSEGTILWFDTEQTPKEFSYFQRMIYRLAGWDTLNPNIRYEAFNLRRYTYEERLFIIDSYIQKYKETLKMVVIDGIADLIDSSNNQEGSTRLVGRLLFWADEFDIVIFTALHTNKDGKNATGHLGGYLDKKASYLIRTEKTGVEGPTTVKVHECRSGEAFKAFDFWHDDTGVPTLTNPIESMDLDASINTDDDVPF